jgi:hypothetical protein
MAVRAVRQDARAAMTAMLHPQLRAECEAVSLSVALVVEGSDPAMVAAERGVSRPALVEQLRAAVGLAIRYERLLLPPLEELDGLSHLFSAESSGHKF